MFKLIATVLILSDTGAPSTSITSLDIATIAACKRLEHAMTYEATHQFQGRSFLVKARARCEPDGAERIGARPGYIEGPPPIGLPY